MQNYSVVKGQGLTKIVYVVALSSEHLSTYDAHHLDHSLPKDAQILDFLGPLGHPGML